MSMRPNTELKAPSVSKSPTTESPVGVLEWKDLSETEKSAASLGVDPEQWKPIGFLNTAHYDTLLKANALDDGLAKKLEVCTKHTYITKKRPIAHFRFVVTSTGVQVSRDRKRVKTGQDKTQRTYAFGHCYRHSLNRVIFQQFGGF
jgi:hypothetical protein